MQRAEPSGAEVQGPGNKSATRAFGQSQLLSQSQTRSRFFSTPQLDTGNQPRRGSLDNLLGAVSKTVTASTITTKNTATKVSKKAVVSQLISLPACFRHRRGAQCTARNRTLRRRHPATWRRRRPSTNLRQLFTP